MIIIYTKLIFYDPRPLWRGHTIYAWSNHKKTKQSLQIIHMIFKIGPENNEKTIEKKRKKSEI